MHVVQFLIQNSFSLLLTLLLGPVVTHTPPVGADLSRRHFLGAGLATTLSTGVGLAATPVRVPIGVHDEWATLRVVILGEPAQEQTNIKDGTSRDSLGVRGNDDEPRFVIHNQDSSPSRTMRQEIAFVSGALGRSRARILRSKDAAPLFPRDSMLVIGNTIIQLNRRNSEGQQQKTISRIVAQAASELKYRRLVMPQTPHGTSKIDEQTPYLEGGDIFVFGRNILVGHSGRASSLAGIAWLKGEFSPRGYQIHRVDLASQWLHLDHVLGSPREGLAVCHIAGLRHQRKSLPRMLRHWEVMNATEHEATDMACNLVSISPSHILVTWHHDRLRERLEDRGVKSVLVPCPTLARMGGGPRRLLLPLVRSGETM